MAWQPRLTEALQSSWPDCWLARGGASLFARWMLDLHSPSPSAYAGLNACNVFIQNGFVFIETTDSFSMACPCLTCAET